MRKESNMTELSKTTSRVIIVTAADHRFYHLLDELITSIRSERGSVSVDIGCFDLGLTSEQIDRLKGHGVFVIHPTTGLKSPATETRGSLCFLARPYLRENFPDYDVYLWLDADTWVQGDDWLRLMTVKAENNGAAFILENDPSYRSNVGLFLWKGKHYLQGYGSLRASRLLLMPQINNGVFAMRADAPYWSLWQQYYQSALSRTGRPAPHDQFAVNVAVRLSRASDCFLPPTFNWICDLSLPHWDEDRQCFCTPDKGRRPIHIVHLAGPIKATTFDITTTDDRVLRGTLRYGANRTLIDEAIPAIVPN
jgi:hypothetical protein